MGGGGTLSSRQKINGSLIHLFAIILAKAFSQAFTLIDDARDTLERAAPGLTCILGKLLIFGKFFSPINRKLYMSRPTFPANFILSQTSLVLL